MPKTEPLMPAEKTEPGSASGDGANAETQKDSGPYVTAARTVVDHTTGCHSNLVYNYRLLPETL
ncbi:hypothetical protein K449DRAFT_137795 [Hypoxylon sp. EC38]|nr:hypothetical protein K449DRAFT_137795 [Hypoxylon sp. EC38]